MEVWEKINYLLEEKNMSKQDFANKLIELEPRLKRTSETPSTQTILGYLYAKEIEIKNLRLIFIGKINKIPVEILRSRVRETYV